LVVPFTHFAVALQKTCRVDFFRHVAKTPFTVRVTAFVVLAGQIPLRDNFKVLLLVMQIAREAFGVHVIFLSDFAHFPVRKVDITT
jgi:hypothetical protein